MSQNRVSQVQQFAYYCRQGVSTPGRPKHPGSPRTHDVEAQISTVGGGDFPPAACRPADTVTTASTGAGRGVKILAVMEGIKTQRRVAAMRHVHFLLAGPLEEAVASALPPPLVRAPNEGPCPRPWLPRDIPLERVTAPQPREVQPPIAATQREPLVPPEEVHPPAAAEDVGIPVPVEVSEPPASAPTELPSVVEAVPLTTGSEGAVGCSKPTLTFGLVASSMRPYWLAGFARIPALAEELLSSTDSSLCLEDIILTAEAMTAQRQDMALCLHGWLRDRSGPEHDPRAVLDELLNLFSTLKDVE